ncbi:hypothetical protein K1T71_011833 [Dendrolimus kikuchii]|uniref:Uncharacterized protein n=1 Tax=Dendrolimus kikuchii TaxID=765133 RepID=A0ACC1CM75_9NEOP|nr:hypothetical protein K1T71_011833 [Dendrolimus kikuchii]
MCFLCRKTVQKYYFDRNAKPLVQLAAKDKVMLYDCEKKMWKPGQIVKLLKEPRSYLVRTQDGQCVRRNRRFIKLWVGKNGNEKNNASCLCKCNINCKSILNGYKIPMSNSNPEIISNDFNINNYNNNGNNNYILRDRSNIKVPKRFQT